VAASHGKAASELFFLLCFQIINWKKKIGSEPRERTLKKSVELTPSCRGSHKTDHRVKMFGQSRKANIFGEPLMMSGLSISSFISWILFLELL